MRSPAVTVAMLIILALGFGTAALADSGPGKLGTVTRTVTTVINGVKTTVVKTTTTGDDDKRSTDGSDDDQGDDRPKTTTTATVTNPDGTTSEVAAAELEPEAAPVLGQSAAVTPVAGTVLVKLPGRDDYVDLGAAASVPMGATLDATKGTVRLTSAHDANGTPQSAEFRSGVFTVTGQTTGANPVTNLVLAGGDFDAACGKAKLSFAKHPPVRQLWGSGHGRFKTTGRYSAATVRGTIWLTRDTCDGTLTIVQRGVVAVRDQVRKKTVMVRAGHTYFARAPLPVSAATKLLGF